MAYVPQNMDRASELNRGLMNTYLYVSETDDLASITGEAGYFDDASYTTDEGWPGGWVFCRLSDGHHVLVIEEDGRTVKKL